MIFMLIFSAAKALLFKGLRWMIDFQGTRLFTGAFKVSGCVTEAASHAFSTLAARLFETPQCLP
jgi:hypothetical protein